jgi:hypothetical protein
MPNTRWRYSSTSMASAWLSPATISRWLRAARCPRLDAHPAVVLNQFVSDSYQKAIRTLIEQRPDLIAPGHGSLIPVTEQMLLATKARIDRRAAYTRN